VTDPERDHFVRRLRDLERSRGRWRLAALALACLLALPVVCGGIAGLWWVPRLRLERERMEVDRAMLEELERERTEKVIREVEQHLGTGKE
jgi:hypothetical protein